MPPITIPTATPAVPPAIEALAPADVAAWTCEPTLSASKHDDTHPRPAHLPKVYSPECVERLSGNCAGNMMFAYALRYGEQEIPYGFVR
jgi:hypothetical protein